MALQINSELKTRHGFLLENTYSRITVIDGIGGDFLHVNLTFYTTKENFKNHADSFDVAGISDNFVVAYDRSKDGVDTLAFAHQEAVKYLAQQGIDATILLDSLI